MPLDARAVFERIRGRKVLVVGDVMIDEWIWGTVTRISPEAPVPVVAVSDHSFTLGGAGNVANNLRALGAEVSFFATVGDDAFAEQVRDLLRGEQVDDGGRFRAARTPDDPQNSRRRPQSTSGSGRLGIGRAAVCARARADRRVRSARAPPAATPSSSAITARGCSRATSWRPRCAVRSCWPIRNRRTSIFFPA